MKAFERYYNMGDRRSYRRIAEEYAIHPLTVFNWAKKFQWQARIAERKAAIAERLRRDSIHDAMKTRKRFVDEISKLFDRFVLWVEEEERAYEEACAEAREKGTPLPRRFSVIRDMSDLEKLAKLHLLFSRRCHGAQGECEQ
ncbi:MAG TPA: hypothetical protein VMT71_02145 [Syntrophorhabdales bacterium]|nr:hypothetical protein [Syntrophorhabdales bacterium]